MKADITGQRFGKLVAIRPTGRLDYRNNVLWECQCDCGGRKIAKVSELRRGGVKSCGCLYREDLAGRRFGRLTVIRFAGTNLTTDRTQWVCKCDCGIECVVNAHELKSGDTRSCGCLMYEVNSEIHSTHGESKTRLYKIWKQMRQRCDNPNDSSYSEYGEFGIVVCSDWQDYVTFRDWAISSGYSDDLSIDRVNPFRDYISQNCVWSGTYQQAKNKRQPYINFAWRFAGEVIKEMKTTSDLNEMADLVIEYLNLTFNDAATKLYQAIPYSILGADYCRDLRGFGTVEAILEEIVWRFVSTYIMHVVTCIRVYQGGSEDEVNKISWNRLLEYGVDIRFTLDDFHKVMQEHFMKEVD